MKKRKTILVGSADRTKVKKRRRRIGTFSAETLLLKIQKSKSMSVWNKILADVSNL
tara:strand:- start:5669 stop:5836 length:168 start_codon:yes stop_codon:yes gene_type:complete